MQAKMAADLSHAYGCLYVGQGLNNQTDAKFRAGLGMV